MPDLYYRFDWQDIRDENIFGGMSPLLFIDKIDVNCQIVNASVPVFFTFKLYLYALYCVDFYYIITNDHIHSIIF
jgi:hypothetical protein